MRTVSFYSYKGGTGRTLLVANIAVLAARLGMRVVMIDLDLEAPGLPYKFFPEPPDRPGVLEWLIAPRRPTLDELAEPISLSSPFRPGGSLTLISAGARPSREYMKAMRKLQEGPLAGDAEDAITSLLMLREAVMQQLSPDLLLLDARTGITTTNAITTRVLADDVVALTLNTPEQLDGTRAVLRSLVPLKKPGEDTPLGLYVVLSRMPSKPPEAGPYEWTDDERAAIGKVSDFLTEPAVPLPTTLTAPRVLLLHNDTDVAKNERILLGRSNALESTTLHVDYLRVAYELLGDLDALIDEAMSATSDETQRRDWATFFARTDLIVETKPTRPEPQAPPLEPVEETTPAERVRILSRLARDDATRSPDLAAALEVLAKARHDSGEHDEAIATIEDAVDWYRGLSEGSAPYLRRYVMALNTLSSYYSGAGKDREALDVAKQATDVMLTFMREARREEDLPLLATTLAALGLRYGAADDYGSGLTPLEDATRIFRDLNAASPPGGYRAQLASALNVLGMLNARVGFTNADFRVAGSAQPPIVVIGV
jgi:tetratricopeptide (TPR) repeat protein